MRSNSTRLRLETLEQRDNPATLILDSTVLGVVQPDTAQVQTDENSASPPTDQVSSDQIPLTPPEITPNPTPPSSTDFAPNVDTRIATDLPDETGLQGTASGEADELVMIEDGEEGEPPPMDGNDPGNDPGSEPSEGDNSENSSENNADPPKADDLKWSDYPEIPKEKMKGIHAMTAFNDKAKVLVDWNADAPKKNAGNLETTAKVTKITSKTFEAIFNKDDSYVVKGKQTDKLLAHEQLHLRIAEYIATKALANFPEDDFKKITVSGSGKDMDALQADLEKKMDAAVDKKTDEYAKVWKAIDEAVQKKYDSETDHGRKAKEQGDWEAKFKQFADAILKDKGWTK